MNDLFLVEYESKLYRPFLQQRQNFNNVNYILKWNSLVTNIRIENTKVE